MSQMAKKAKKRNPKKDIAQIEKAAVRQEMKEQGAFDGRFRSKVVPNKRKYTRKRKKDDNGDPI